MEYAILILSLISGAIFRRWWGGWFSPNATLKRIIGFILPLTVCFFVFGINWLTLIIPSFILFGWLMPYHGYGISMGRWPNHPLWSCILVMLAQYGGLTVIAGIVWEIMSKGTGGLIYAPIGCIIPFAYYASWELWERFKLKSWGEYPEGNWFVDGAGSYSELMLGALLIGGIPLAHIIAG